MKQFDPTHRGRKVYPRRSVSRKRRYLCIPRIGQCGLSVYDLNIVSKPCREAIPRHLQFTLGEYQRLIGCTHLLGSCRKRLKRKTNILFYLSTLIFELQFGLAKPTGGDANSTPGQAAVEDRNSQTNSDSSGRQIIYLRRRAA
jgi:hypothetical protein